jgi:hypothetical protein
MGGVAVKVGDEVAVVATEHAHTINAAMPESNRDIILTI